VNVVKVFLLMWVLCLGFGSLGLACAGLWASRRPSLWALGRLLALGLAVGVVAVTMALWKQNPVAVCGGYLANGIVLVGLLPATDAARSWQRERRGRRVARIGLERVGEV
jgi:hypothetical protein